MAGYNLYYGGASGTYTNEIAAGNATNATLVGLVPGNTYYFAATTYNVLGLESALSSEVSYFVPTTVPITNQPPTLNAIGDLSINENAGLQVVSLSGISTGGTNGNQTLSIAAISGNTGLIPNPTVNYTNPAATGNLTFAPVANANGSATITVTANNGGASNNIVIRTFTVTVNSVNQAPTLNAIANLTIGKNATRQTVNLSGISSGAANENQVLIVQAASSNPGVIPNPTVNYTSASSTGSLTFTPAYNMTGLATVTVTVNDGGTSNNIVTRMFTVTVTNTTSHTTGGSPPQLSNQLTNQGALKGQNRTFSIRAAGSGLRYQWKFNGSDVARATSTSLTLRNLTTNQAGVYSVTVTSRYGSTNSAARLYVYSTPAAPVAPIGMTNGQYTLSVPDVSGCRYIVQASTDLVNWVPVRTNTAPFTFTDAQTGQFGQRYYRTVYAP